MRLLILMILVLSPICGESAEFQILNAEDGPAIFPQCSRPSPQPESFFRPTQKEIAIIDKSIRDVSKLKAKCCFGDKIEQPEDFMRQYIGYYSQERRLIYVNAFPKGFESDKTIELVKACDGGPHFWGVSYDPASGKFFDLAINGAM